MKKRIVFFDLETNIDKNSIKDIGAIDNLGNRFHKNNIQEFVKFIQGADYLCGHNIINHDLPVLEKILGYKLNIPSIDTLFLSPLLFPKKPYHKLLKDDKIYTEELNNPFNDALKAKELFDDEMDAFKELENEFRRILFCLLNGRVEFAAFFSFMNFASDVKNPEESIKNYFYNKICGNSILSGFIDNNPMELAYALALINTSDSYSITPRWLQLNYPTIDNIMMLLCNTPCEDGCSYCEKKLDIHVGLKRVFGFDSFRSYDGEPLQENAVSAAVHGKSLLAIFPTGGGKSITFQLPAIMAGDNARGLTIVISPLQSLMKDQVDNLTKKGISGAVTINGLLSPIERKSALEQIENGTANLLYLSPESLRSKTIERVITCRNIVRFVIDEAHCFSSWGQDFRVDYLYIAEFIKRIQQIKQSKKPIPVSCFTATAKQKVVTDICDYFATNLDLHLELFTTSADRKNLHYTVLYKNSNEEKYAALRNLIAAKKCPTIVYVSRTKKAEDIAKKLEEDGFSAKAFHGQMDPKEKVENQDAFIKGKVQVIVATSAFGMGVDKSDVQLVIHYNISDSLENYVQEAGRAGRDEKLNAECFILFNNEDLDKHFMLLNQTKLSIGEIQDVWRAIKVLSGNGLRVCCSALEIAKYAGWDDTQKDIETRVKTAIAALEDAGYIKRGKNVPHVYATSILVRDMIEGSNKISQLVEMDDKEKAYARIILQNLISSKIYNNRGDDAESRVDYIADINGIDKRDVINVINKLRNADILADDEDMTCYVTNQQTEAQIKNIVEKYELLEKIVVEYILENGTEINKKELNEYALSQMKGKNGSMMLRIDTILNFLAIKNLIKKREDKGRNIVQVEMQVTAEQYERIFEKRVSICEYCIETLMGKAYGRKADPRGNVLVGFSLISLLKGYNNRPSFFNQNVEKEDVEDALLYLAKIGALKLEGGFLVIYNGMEIQRRVIDNKIRYKVEDYRKLDEFYKQKIQQIHIVGEYAKLMVKDYNAALGFVHDYFNLDYKQFLSKYFKGEKEREITKNITPDKYKKLFGELSEKQLEIINDFESKYILVVAGPGSGKTKLLAHKLASLLMMEDVKHEQLLMLTFSRAAATEFKKRLMTLIGNAASFVEIKTFHSYCFDLIGKIGSIEESNNVVEDAAELIANSEVETGKITKKVLVIDEAQDMDSKEFNLVRSLMSLNDDMRVIAVGDDDQNIYEFRGSKSDYMGLLVKEYGAKYYEMIQNFRSKSDIVKLSNILSGKFRRRMKTHKIVSMVSEPGTVKIVDHPGRHFEQSLVEGILASNNKKGITVLTNTNEEALLITGLLNNSGVRAKLIQSLDGFKLSDLMEIRGFMQLIEQEKESKIISDEVWDKSINVFKQLFKGSSCLENCLNIFEAFDSVNIKYKYKSDFREFIEESDYNDFYGDDAETVYVSTIHKSKGRESENVYLYLDNVSTNTDEELRKIYVGATRAKSNLYIYHNIGLFRAKEIVSNFDVVTNNKVYSEPNEITVQFTHKDVVLDYFINKRDKITKYRSGDRLILNGLYLEDEKGYRLAKLSQKKIGEIEELKNKGYSFKSASIRFIVAWKKEDNPTLHAIILPSVDFVKEKGD